MVNLSTTTARIEIFRSLLGHESAGWRRQGVLEYSSTRVQPQPMFSFVTCDVIEPRRIVDVKLYR